jgi:hypothetical protein
VCGLHYYKLEI